MGDETLTKQLLDRQAVVNVVAQSCQLVEEYDIGGLAEVFTPDCFTDYGASRGGPVSGIEAILARFTNGQAGFRRTQHHLGQTLVHLDGDEAATTYVTATHEDWSGAVSRIHPRYVDQLRRTPAGWRIQYREVLACVLDGMEGAAWSYVVRKQPPR